MTGATWSKKNSAVEQKESSRNLVPSVEPSKPLDSRNVVKTPPPEGMPTSQSEIPDENLVVTRTPESKGIGEAQPAVENIGESTNTMVPSPPTDEKPALETQPRLRGVEPKKRLPDSQNEEDLLEIPAFLRRQAN